MKREITLTFQDLFVSILPKEAMGEDFLHFQCCIANGNHVGVEQHENDLAIMNLQDAKDFHFRLGEMIKTMESKLSAEPEKCVECHENCDRIAECKGGVGECTCKNCSGTGRRG